MMQLPGWMVTVAGEWSCPRGGLGVAEQEAHLRHAAAVLFDLSPPRDAGDHPATIGRAAAATAAPPPAEILAGPHAETPDLLDAPAETPGRHAAACLLNWLAVSLALVSVAFGNVIIFHSLHGCPCAGSCESEAAFNKLLMNCV